MCWTRWWFLASAAVVAAQRQLDQAGTRARKGRKEAARSKNAGAEGAAKANTHTHNRTRQQAPGISERWIEATTGQAKERMEGLIHVLMRTAGPIEMRWHCNLGPAQVGSLLVAFGVTKSRGGLQAQADRAGRPSIKGPTLSTAAHPSVQPLAGPLSVPP
ncbi:hypothetical protein VTI74DRAFT_11507 [Chaetomium olivicolor]